MTKIWDKIFKFEKTKKGGQVEKTSFVKSADTTPVWIGATVIFALLFFLSSVLDMKVRVTFGQESATGTTKTTTTTTQPTNTGIASQVGGC